MSGLLEHLLSMPAWLVLLAVFALPALESSAFLGFLFPGESAVLLGGVAASQGHVPLAAVMVGGVGGAILGDAVGYVVGRRWGRRILSRRGRLTNHRHLERAERALLRGGGRAVFLGRFTVALRVMIPGLAGMARMPYRRFAAANIAGGIAWGVLIATAGYLAGNSWHTVEHYIAEAGAGVTVAVVALLLAGNLIRRRVRLRREQPADSTPSARPPASLPA
jgi:membrane-associated protein